MTDVLVALVTIAFFGLCVAYVSLCDRIIGSDEAVASDPVVPARSHSAVIDEAA